MKAKPVGYFVMYDDGDLIRLPMGADPECEGAIHLDETAPLLFASPAEARHAIAISTHKMSLDLAQGKPANEDFTRTNRKNLKIVPVFDAKVPTPNKPAK